MRSVLLMQGIAGLKLAGTVRHQSLNQLVVIPSWPVSYVLSVVNNTGIATDSNRVFSGDGRPIDQTSVTTTRMTAARDTSAVPCRNTPFRYQLTPVTVDSSPAPSATIRADALSRAIGRLLLDRQRLITVVCRRGQGQLALVATAGQHHPPEERRPGKTWCPRSLSSVNRQVAIRMAWWHRRVVLYAVHIPAFLDGDEMISEAPGTMPCSSFSRDVVRVHSVHIGGDGHSGHWCPGRPGVRWAR
jgi:hypothetical protein